MAEPYILFGSYASYYTAKVRGYLRKKNIPFVEYLPSHPLFREKVRPASGSVRIPQLLSPGGEVVQDSVEIMDYLEERFPDVPAFPPGARQRTVVHLMELLGGEGLLLLAWKHRWIFFSENSNFVRMDFGRSFKPQGSDEELLKYGGLIAERMMTRGNLPEATDTLKADLDRQYIRLLALYERHFKDHPYFLGGHPCAADYAVMGALHAHMGRDPAGLRVMQNHAPRVFRWVEHMLVPEIRSPEFHDSPIAYPGNDEIPATALAIVRAIADAYGERFVLGVLAFNQWVQREDPESGFVIDKDNDQPNLAEEQVAYSDKETVMRANLYQVWLGQRSRCFFADQTPEVRDSILALLGEGLASEFLATPVAARLKRVNNRLQIA
jgi:glutathione S-transferase